MASAPIYKKNKVMEREGADEETEPKKAKGEEGKNEHEKPKAKGGEKHSAGKSEHEDKPGEGSEGEGKAKTVHERHKEAREAMRGRHESELKDHHNNHREATKQMHARHEADHHDMNMQQEAELASLSGQGGGAVGAGQAPMAQAAPGGGMQSPAAM